MTERKTEKSTQVQVKAEVRRIFLKARDSPKVGMSQLGKVTRQHSAS